MDGKTRIAVPIEKHKIGLTLHADNKYLLDMLSLNWGEDHSLSERELNLHLTTDKACDYSIQRLDKDSWLCKGVYNYSALKIAVRGILSDAAIEDTIFVHGCCFELRTKGLKKGMVLVGASGAGKTTLVSRLANQAGIDFRIVNDDWGPMGISKKIVVSTEEKYFHMKMGSAMAINPDFSKESMLFQEEYRDGIRGFALPDMVYSQRIKQTKADTWVILTCNREYGQYYKKVDADTALEIIMNGSYSPFYNRKEWFMNGSLILDSEERRTLHKRNLYHALQNIDIVVINNAGSQEDLYNNFKKATGLAL